MHVTANEIGWSVCVGEGKLGCDLLGESFSYLRVVFYFRLKALNTCFFHRDK